MADLSEKCPPQWAKQVKPLLQRASEFQTKQPSVAYYIKTYAAHLAMQLRKPTDDKESTKFLMTLLTILEQEKTQLGAELGQSDGRTTLTKAALMLFTKADDMERAGQVSQQIVKLFFASSQLFEATKMYTDSGEMDPIATEKCKYAKYIVLKMKKALDEGTLYVSPNEEARSAAQQQQQQPLQQQPPPPTAPPPPPPPSHIPPTASTGGFSFVPPPPAQPPQQQQQVQQYPTTTPPPPPPQWPAAPPPSATPAGYPSAAMQAQPAPPPPRTTQPSASPTPAGAMDAVIEAQKYAKQAVAALQFYDLDNARTQLLAALNALDRGAPRR